MVDKNDDLLPPKKNSFSIEGTNKLNEKNHPSLINIPPLRDNAEEEGNRKTVFKNKISGLIIGVTISFALMGVSFWWGLEIGRQSNNQVTNPIPIITADDGPIKIKPKDPKGLTVPHKDILVLDNSKNLDALENDNILILPKPEKPVIIKEKSNNDILNNLDQQIDKNTQSNIEVSKKNNFSNNDKDLNLNNNELNILKKENQNINNNNSKIIKKNNKNINDESIGTYKVQLASYRKESSAMEGWNNISKKNLNLFNNLKPKIVKVNIANKGIYFRLQTGSFLDKDSANNFCEKLKKIKINCLLVKVN